MVTKVYVPGDIICEPNGRELPIEEVIVGEDLHFKYGVRNASGKRIWIDEDEAKIVYAPSDPPTPEEAAIDEKVRKMR